jgi:DNA-binding response OmpR family regulator
VLYRFMKENGIPTDALESGRRKALIVDDDEDLVELIRDALENDGRFEVRIANNGFSAGMMVKEYRPDIIVLDIMLPDINGKDVCHLVRSDSSLDDTKIICISGMVEQDKVQELMESGANDFLQKPFEVETLVERMCHLLDVEPVEA